MSETREAYDVTTQPARELDELTARVMGWTSIHWVDTEYGSHPFGAEPDGQIGVMLPFFSTDGKAALEAWAWLEDNIGPRYKFVLLVRDDKPSVCFCWHAYEPEKIIEGDTYPHAIALAILEISKTTGGPNESA